MQLATLVGVLEKLDATVVSLGCGEGWLEGLLERADLDVPPPPCTATPGTRTALL